MADMATSSGQLGTSVVETG
ncbi:hypothetical protein LINPERHAP2_LOCUS6368 [Linum perenne]